MSFARESPVASICGNRGRPKAGNGGKRRENSAGKMSAFFFWRRIEMPRLLMSSFSSRIEKPRIKTRAAMPEIGAHDRLRRTPTYVILISASARLSLGASYHLSLPPSRKYQSHIRRSNAALMRAATLMASGQSAAEMSAALAGPARRARRETHLLKPEYRRRKLKAPSRQWPSAAGGGAWLAKEQLSCSSHQSGKERSGKKADMARQIGGHVAPRESAETEEEESGAGARWPAELAHRHRAKPARRPAPPSGAWRAGRGRKYGAPSRCAMSWLLVVGGRRMARSSTKPAT